MVEYVKNSGHTKTHWRGKRVGDIQDWYGFTYLITNTANNRKYIGRKSFWRKTRRKLAGRVNRKIVNYESDWKTYTGSSDELNKDILTYGKDSFTFKIIRLYRTRSGLRYGEISAQVKTGCLHNKIVDGSTGGTVYEYYNGQIDRFRGRVSEV